MFQAGGSLIRWDKSCIRYCVFKLPVCESGWWVGYLLSRVRFMSFGQLNWNERISGVDPKFPLV